MTQTQPNSPAVATGVGELVASIVKQYPAFGPLITKIPELGDLLVQAATPGNQWSPQQLQSKIEGTTWWRSASDTQKSWEVQKLTDPAQSAQQNAASAQQIMAQAATSGIMLTPLQVATLAEASNEHQWTPGQMQQNIGAQANEAHLSAGTIENTAAQLGQTAYNYGVPLAPATSFDWAKKINQGLATTDGFNAYAIDQAKGLYPTLSKHLDQGMTVRQLADPYLQIAGTTLGVDPNALSLNDPKWSAALQSQNAQGQLQGPMSLQQWQQKLMTDNQYGYAQSTNGKQAGLELAQNLATTMGLKTGGSQIV